MLRKWAEGSLPLKIVVHGAVWLGLAMPGLVIVIAQPAGAQAGTRSDGQIEMDVVHALDGSKALKNDLITVATIQGEVTLSGTVSNEASRELAEAIVSRVEGVTAVHNNLKVGDAQVAATSQPAPQPSDEAVAPAQPSESGPQPEPGQSPYPSQSASDQASGVSQEPGQYPQLTPPPSPDAGPSRPQPGYDAGPQYPPAMPPRPPRYSFAAGPVTIPEGTPLQLRTSEAVSSKHAKDGTPVEFVVIRDVVAGGALAIPRGATVHGVVTESKKAGDLGGSPELGLQLTSLELGGKNYPLETDQFKVKGPNKAGQTVNNAVGGAIFGTIIGCIAGRGAGCAIGAAAGAGAGVAASAATPGPNAWIPAEALVVFHLATPITVEPVDRQEAARLAQGLYQGGPTLYRRGPYYSQQPYAAAYPYYGYPPVFYRPYFMVGGAYYWR